MIHSLIKFQLSLGVWDSLSNTKNTNNHCYLP